MSSDVNATELGEITARYLMVTADDPTAAAHAIAGEMSSGTFRPVPGETPELSARHRARVIDLSPAPDTEARRLCVSGTPWTMSITVPGVNVGASLSQVLATVAGNIFELAGPAALLLEGLDLPQGGHRALSWTPVRHRRVATRLAGDRPPHVRFDRQTKRRPVARRQ